ncbi:uncharacterized protein BDW70DRAFT_157928 [Aspergillus foveolatus]|uniref:uncharacterized protein n=1 Tax=Aspergillus foveolatus TaxID=210207 RepID=UPI003CCDCB36
MPMKWTPEKDQLLLLKILETHDFRLDPKRVAEVWRKSRRPFFISKSEFRPNQQTQHTATIENQDKPTPRAITERLARIRAMVKPGKSNNSSMICPRSGSSSLSPASKRGRKPGTPNSTPRSGQRKKAADKIENGKNVPTQNSQPKSDMDLDDDDTTVAADAEHELDTDFVTGEVDSISIKTPTKKGNGQGLLNFPTFKVPSLPPASSPAAATAGLMGSRQTQEGSDVQAGVSLGLRIGKEAQQSLDVVGDGSPVKRTSRARRATTKLGLISYTYHLADGEDGFGGHTDEVDSSASDYVPDSAVLDEEDFA